MLDLGTNNCRLLIARVTGHQQFQVIDSFSRIVQLGQGVAQSGVLSGQAIDRTIAALKICAARIRSHEVTDIRAIATEACRRASNAQVLLDRAKAEAGIDLTILSADDEAYLAALGCAPLIGKKYEGALIFDIGGGSTEAIWMRRHEGRLHLQQAISVPIGVVSLAEDHPAPITPSNYVHMAKQVMGMFGAVRARMDEVADFNLASHHLLGTSGTVTTLAGISMGLPRYVRAKVDATWHNSQKIAYIAEHVVSLDMVGRSALGCVGQDRAELIVPGCAIYSAIHAHWPCAELRVADRGLREGMLRQMMAKNT